MYREKAFRLDIFINGRPVDAHAVSDQFPAVSLIVGRIAKTGKPFERGGNLPPIGKKDTQRIR